MTVLAVNGYGQKVNLSSTYGQGFLKLFRAIFQRPWPVMELFKVSTRSGHVYSHHVWQFWWWKEVVLPQLNSSRLETIRADFDDLGGSSGFSSYCSTSGSPCMELKMVKHDEKGERKGKTCKVLCSRQSRSFVAGWPTDERYGEGRELVGLFEKREGKNVREGECKERRKLKKWASSFNFPIL